MMVYFIIVNANLGKYAFRWTVYLTEMFTMM